MPRVTNAVASRKRRKRRLNQAKGFYGSRSKLFRMATEAVDRSMRLSYTHRKDKKREYRGLWMPASPRPASSTTCPTAASSKA